MIVSIFVYIFDKLTPLKDMPNYLLAVPVASVSMDLWCIFGSLCSPRKLKNVMIPRQVLEFIQERLHL